MKKTPRYLAYAAIAAVLLAACGDDSPSGDAPSDSLPIDTVAPVDTTAPPTTVLGGVDHPTGADDVVVRIAYEGGFVPVEVAFLNLPTLLVTGDGHAIVQGPIAEIYPGPLLPNMQARPVTEAGIQDLLGLAEDHGLLADVEYTNPTNIADAPDTVVEIATNGETFVHRAYALGIGDETDPARAALADFFEQATGDWLHGDNPELGPEAPYTSDTFLIRASEVGDYAGDIEPTVVGWPADASVRLATASECAAVPAAEVGNLFADANQLTFFTEDGITYQVTVKPQLPGDSC
ncbi:MAG TPA: hypothetical protein VF065_01770 [Ilumatobacter sp.]